MITISKLKFQKHLLFDGAFGTYYFALTGNNQPPELANINDSQTVIKIHKEYIAAGASAIKTNTFGICSAIAPSMELQAQLIRRGWENASLAAAGSDTLIFADMGPAPFTEEESTDYSINSLDVFIQCGAKHFIFETLPSFERVENAVCYIKNQVRDAYIIVSFAVGQDGYTSKGIHYKQLFTQAKSSGQVDAIGLNCVCGPAHAIHLIDNITMDAALSIMPNAGYPSNINGRTVYIDNISYFAERLSGISNQSVRILGGCCGTTPAHIKAVAEMLQRNAPSMTEAIPEIKEEQHTPISKNLFKEKLEQGKKIVAVELDPPNDTSFEATFEKARQLKECGVDILTFADSPLARTRADSIMTAAKIKRDTGLCVLPHLTCRDRNIIAIKAALLGGYMESIENILALTGDPVPQGGETNAKSVFSLNSFLLTGYINSLNRELFADKPYYIGGALNINSTNFYKELERAKKKIQNGTQYLLTQSMFSEKALENLKTAKKELDCKILGGIMPLAGYRNAVFINNEVPGIEIPAEFIAFLKDKSKDETEEIVLDFCTDMAKKANSYCDGYFIMTPLNKTSLVCALIEKMRSEGLC